MEPTPSLTIGTLSGTLLSILPQLNSQDILVTVVLAMVGAITSFLVTVLLKWMQRVFRK
jgi:H+/Cl- antiporter ClcA